MKNYNPNNVVVTGIGVTSAIGQGKKDFFSALLEGHHSFRVMQRPGRQKDGSSFLGAEISSLTIPEDVPKKLLRTASYSGQVAMAALHEAWNEARLFEVDPSDVGLIVGGSNFQQRHILEIYESYMHRPKFIKPTFGFSFMDSDLCGLCTEQFGIQGASYTIGGASASGQAAIIQAVQAVLSGEVQVCIAIGALMDISYLECQALRALGAMGTDRFAEQPGKASRPFDKERDGFIYGEACGVVVIERGDMAEKRNIKPYAAITGWATVMDGNRNPNPSYHGEVKAILRALEKSNLKANEIDYINPHGTGSLIGDEIELKAIADCGLSSAYINATKSIVGHGLSAAGAVEVIATLLQMKESKLHPTLNLDNPIDASFNWVRGQSVSCNINRALNLSMGFGGVNTAICLEKC